MKKYIVSLFYITVGAASLLKTELESTLSLPGNFFDNFEIPDEEILYELETPDED